MAWKYDKLVSVMETIETKSEKSEESLQGMYTECLGDIAAYLAKGDLSNVYGMQDDQDILNQIGVIVDDYNESYKNMNNLEKLDGKTRNTTLKVIARNRTRIRVLQSLINKKLEEL